MTPHIVFDLGNVLIGWQPELAFHNHFDDLQLARDWLDRIDFHDWNRTQDGGRSITEGIAVARAAHGDAANPLGSYKAGFPLTIREPIPGTWQIAEGLKAAGHRMFAITNWSADNWPAALETYPLLTTLFEDIVVSGIEGMLKPEPAIYLALTQRNGIAPSDCLFIDDSEANVRGARDVGMDAIHFTNAPALGAALRERGIATAG